MNFFKECTKCGSTNVKTVYYKISSAQPSDDPNYKYMKAIIFSVTPKDEYEETVHCDQCKYVLIRATLYPNN